MDGKGVDFPSAREKYGDRMTNAYETSRIFIHAAEIGDRIIKKYKENREWNYRNRGELVAKIMDNEFEKLRPNRKPIEETSIFDTYKEIRDRSKSRKKELKLNESESRSYHNNVIGATMRLLATTEYADEYPFGDNRNWKNYHQTLYGAGPFYTRTFTAFSEAPLGDLERDGGRIFISQVIDGNSLRFGGLTEADAKTRNIKLNRPGTLLVIDRKYKMTNEGAKSYSLIITPEISKLVDSYYNVKYNRGWRKFERKHGLPIGEEKDDGEAANVGYLDIFNNIGPVMCGRNHLVQFGREEEIGEKAAEFRYRSGTHWLPVDLDLIMWGGDSDLPKNITMGARIDDKRGILAQ